MREPNVTSVVVIGAGVSGLTVAFELLDRAERLGGRLDLVCLEAADRAGGNIRTDRDRGFTCEAGPTGFLDNAPATVTLVRRLGLGERLVRATDAAAARFLWRAGALRAVPMGAAAFLGSGILSTRGKLRLLAEPFASRSTAPDESVYSFAARRIGPEAARVLVDAMVSGVYAGNVRELSLGATFPKMRKMEQEHGSLFRAMLARRRTAKKEGVAAGGPAGPGGTLTSFRTGLEELTAALAERLGKRLRLRTPVRQVSDMGRRGFRILLEEGAPLEADAVVLACPAWHAAPIVEDMDPALAGAMRDIPSAPLVVVHTGFSRMAFAEVPQGFGFLVPRGQGPRILGTLWISNIFPGRTPEGAVLFTTMVGGAHDPGVMELGEAEIMRIVREDLKRTMGVTVAPFFSRMVRWERGIPQYTLGHPDRLAGIDQALARHAGLWVTGNSYRGISVNACVEEAPGVAEALLAHTEDRARVP